MGFTSVVSEAATQHEICGPLPGSIDVILAQRHALSPSGTEHATEFLPKLSFNNATCIRTVIEIWGCL